MGQHFMHILNGPDPDLLDGREGSGIGPIFRQRSRSHAA
jgi:hypothetical protein